MGVTDFFFSFHVFSLNFAVTFSLISYSWCGDVGDVNDREVLHIIQLYLDYSKGSNIHSNKKYLS